MRAAVPLIGSLAVAGLLVTAATQSGKAAGSPDAPVAAPDTSITVLETGPLVVRLPASGKDATLGLTVKNDGAEERALTWELILKDLTGTSLPMTAPTSPSAAKHSVTPVSLTISPKDKGSIARPLSGWLVLKITSSGTTEPVLGMRTMEVRVLPGPGEAWVIGCAFALALVTVTAAAAGILRWRAKDAAPKPLGPPTWNLSESWATNVALGATLLTGILSWGVMPEHLPRYSKSSYLLLSTLFAGLVAIAPILYALVKSIVGALKDLPARVVVALVLLIAFLTFMGALGQMITLIYVFIDLWGANLIAALTAVLFIVLFALLIVVLIIYGVRAPYLTLYAASPATPTAAIAEATDVRPTLRRGSKTADPSWPIF